MATLAGNNAYLTIGGTDVSAYAVVFSGEHSAEEINVTAGFGATYQERVAGLKDFSGTFTIVYETTLAPTHLTLIGAGQLRTIVWGPEGNTAGKPKHEQSCLITGVKGPEVKVDKSMTVFEVSFKGAAAPVTDMYSGGVF
jgi:hypothetical protein